MTYKDTASYAFLPPCSELTFENSQKSARQSISYDHLSSALTSENYYLRITGHAFLARHSAVTAANCIWGMYSQLGINIHEDIYKYIYKYTYICMCVCMTFWRSSNLLCWRSLYLVGYVHVCIYVCMYVYMLDVNRCIGMYMTICSSLLCPITATDFVWGVYSVGNIYM